MICYGTYTAIVTPFKTRVDETASTAYSIANQAGMTHRAVGTTVNRQTVDCEEHIPSSNARCFCPRQDQVIAGTGANSTKRRFI